MAAPGAVAIPLLLVVGGLLAVQGPANVQLATAMGNPFAASTLQLAVGATLFGVLALLVGTIGALHLVPAVTPWHLTGGVASALYVTAGVVLFPRLGAVVTVGLFVAGQMLASLLLDSLGLLGVEARHVTLLSVAGLATVLGGAALIVRAQVVAGRRPASGSERGRWLPLAVLAGACLPVQGAINAQLRLDLRAPVTTGLLSFVVATATTALVLLVRQAVSNAPAPAVGELRRTPWWAWAGGLVGATYVIAVFLLIPIIGTAPTIALTVAGQQLGSIVVDRYGLMRLPKRPIGAVRLTGVGVLLAGVGLFQLTG